MASPSPVSVAVLVELERNGNSGGHVKCWERFAQAAVGSSDIDLTVYVLGPQRRVDPIAENVRFVELRPALTTRPFTNLVGGVDASDFAPYHRALAASLPRHDVWHVTHSLAFAATALRMRGERRRPMVGSLHTDMPTLTRLYTQQVVDQLPQQLGRAVTASRMDQIAPAAARRKRNRVLSACEHVLVSNRTDHEEISRTLPEIPLSRLRRGVDTQVFRPELADRRWLAWQHGVPSDRPVVLFAGRADATKGAVLVAEAMQRLAERGSPAHLVIAGQGASAAHISRLLGDNVTQVGHVPQPELAQIYASCDLLAFPSRSETAGNVVAEAMASGLPVALPRGARTTQWLNAPGEDGLLVDEDNAEAWARTIGGILADAPRRARMGRRAKATSDVSHPSWSTVLYEDLIPVWQHVYRGSHMGPRERELAFAGASAAPIRTEHE